MKPVFAIILLACVAAFSTAQGEMKTVSVSGPTPQEIEAWQRGVPHSEVGPCAEGCVCLTPEEAAGSRPSINLDDIIEGKASPPSGVAPVTISTIGWGNTPDILIQMCPRR